MEQSPDPPEFNEYHDTSHLTAYETECYLKVNSPATLLTPLKSLIRQELQLDDIDANRLTYVLVASDILPNMQHYSDSPNEALEHFALAPLRFLGSYIDTRRQPDEAKEWYEVAVNMALNLAAVHSTKRCLSAIELRSGNDACEESDLCPFKEVRRLLVQPAIDYRFDDAWYALDPARLMTSIQMKLALANKHELITNAKMNELLNERREWHDWRMNDIYGTE